jgi:hypothetical protein
MPVTDQEADVADDTVTDFAKAGEVDEESLLEKRGQRAIKVGRPCEIPETIDQSGRGSRGAEEIRKHSQPLGDQAQQFRSLIRLIGNIRIVVHHYRVRSHRISLLLFYLLIGKQRSTHPAIRTMRAILANA